MDKKAPDNRTAAPRPQAGARPGAPAGQRHYTTVWKPSNQGLKPTLKEVIDEPEPPKPGVANPKDKADPYRVPSAHAVPAPEEQDAGGARAKGGRRHFWIYAGGVLVALGIFAMVFFGIGKSAAPSFSPPSISYVQVGPVYLQGMDYRLVARMEVQVAKGDREWGVQNSVNFFRIVERELPNVDPLTAQTPGGLPKLQERLRDLLNRELQTDRVQAVWMTEFAYLPDAYY